MTVRERLVASRPSATRYAEAIAGLPRDVKGMVGRLGEVVVHPVKGLGGLSVDAARVARGGLVDAATGCMDRGALLAALAPGRTPDGEAFDATALSNRNESAFALVRARHEEGGFVYEALGLPPLRVDPRLLRPRDGPRLRIRLYEGGPVVDGVRAEGPVGDWVAALRDANPGRRRGGSKPLALVVPAGAAGRGVADKHRAGLDVETVYGDAAQGLLASSATLGWMNEVLAADGGRAVPMSVFRPNLVVEGWPPNVEDLVAEAVVEGPDGPVHVVFASLCVRCDATRVDPATGTRPDKEPLAFLARERPPRDGDANAATFAINVAFGPGAEGRRVRAGDPIRILRERA